mmetsp:Transcript_30325/g.49418  ORF Transcript_30325/g.49418 Transcript_30325/m.49418 type:complete len:222 (-) Transcript_30325:14-679(-)
MGALQDGLEVGHRQGVQFDADRQPALQLGNQVARLAEMEGAAGDEEDVVGLHEAVFGRHRGALDQRQQVALHALAGHLGAALFLARRDLVDLVDEDDAHLLGLLQCGGTDLFLVDQLGGFLVDQQLHRLADLELAGLLLARADLAEQALELLGHVLHAGLVAKGRQHLQAGLGREQVELDVLVVQLALAQLLAEVLARRVVRLGAGQQHVQDALLGGVLRP